jgi:hypothetical protein
MSDRKDDMVNDRNKNVQTRYNNLLKKEKHLLDERMIFQHFFEREFKTESSTSKQKFEDFYNERLIRLRDAPTLDITQRYDVVRNELQHVNSKWEMFERKKDEKTDRLLATNQEIISNIKDIKVEVIELNRKIDIQSENPKNGKINAEIFHKFFDEKFKKLDNLKAKLEEQNKNLMKQILMARKKIDKKDKSNELEFIDFHQLQIENKKYVKEVDEKNKLLLKLKMTIGKITQDKNKTKDKLNVELNSLDELDTEIINKQKQIDKIARMIENQEKQREKNDAQTKNLDRKQKKSNLITIDDHVRQKNVEEELKHILSNLEKKLQIEKIKPK